MNYLDFDIEISPDNRGHYTVAVTRSPSGEARERVRFPSELQMESSLKDLEIALLRSGVKRRRVLSKEEQVIQKFGRELFDLLLPNEIRGLYRTSLNKAIEKDSGLRLRLRLKEAPELAILPWEFLYDDNEGEYICLSKDTSIVRYIDFPRPPTPLRVATPLRILGMVASPDNLPKLDVTREKERINRAVADLQEAGVVELHWLPGQTWRDIKKAMREPWHIFHFIGHGGFDAQKDEGFVALCDDRGQAQHFMASDLANLLANQRTLRLVLLNACEGGSGSGQDIFSSAAAILVRRGLPAVLAMQYEISDNAAIELARSFYEGLADGLPVDTAVTEARQSIKYATQGSIEWVTPVLYMRSRDGKLFDVHPAEPPSTPKSPPRQAQAKRKQVRVPPPAAVDEEQFTAVYLAQLRKQLLELFNEDELMELCFVLDIEYEDIGGDNRASKARELVRYLDRRGRVNELLLLCEKERPHVNWREIRLRAVEEPTPQTTRTVAAESKQKMTPEPEGDSFVHEKTGLEFVRVAAGKFLYGDDKETRELPEYWISKTAVTHTVYKRFIDANPKHDVPSGSNNKYSWDKQKRTFPTGKAEHPVVYVSWVDAVAFCKWAGLQLPTEEQWEKAARGTDGRKYPWGDSDPTDKLCNFDSNVGGTTAVGDYAPQGDSPYGCVDMSGNVWEWCLNKYKTPEIIEIDKSGDWRVLRGGSWNYLQRYARAAYRADDLPDYTSNNFGFRVVVRRPPSYQDH